MTIRRALAGTIGGVAALGMLTGCSFNLEVGPYTAPTSTLAQQATDVLEEQTGTRYPIECHDETVTLVENAVIDCVLTDPATGAEYAATITLTEVEGKDYFLSVEAGGDPIN